MSSDCIASWRLIIILLIVTACAVYGNTFLNRWTYDDRYVVVNNPDNHSIREFVENHYPGRPLRELAHPAAVR